MMDLDTAHAIAPMLRRTTRAGNVLATLLQNPWAEQILRDFRWHEYMRAQPDVHFQGEQQARWHLVYNGYREQRLFDLDRCEKLDPGYYRKRYPELELESDDQAQFHYCYAGYYENRFANADTEWIYNADLHIYQPGKVGSYSIAAGLEKAGYSGEVMHLHWLTDMALLYPACSLSYAHILGHDREKPVRVISAAREVVSRVISGAFQYLDTMRTSTGSLDVERAVAHLEDTFLHDCDVITGWFDHQFFCHLDIYAHQFDYERGYVWLRNETVDLFLYRQENLANLGKPLAEFLGLSKFRLQRANAASDKSYGEAYRLLMSRVVVSRKVLKELYATPYMRFFFDDDERARYMDFWSSPRGG